MDNGDTAPNRAAEPSASGIKAAKAPVLIDMIGPSCDGGDKPLKFLKLDVTWLVHVQLAGELAAGIHQDNSSRVFHCVVAPIFRNLLEIGGKGLGGTCRLRGRTAQGHNARVEFGHVERELVCRIPFGIDGDEKRHQPVGASPKFGKQARQFVERRRANVRAMGKAEKDQIWFADQIGIGKGLARKRQKLERPGNRSFANFHDRGWRVEDAIGLHKRDPASDDAQASNQRP